LLSRMPIGQFFKAAFSKETNLLQTKEGNYILQVDGIASFLKIPKIVKLTNMIAPGKDVNIDLSKTRLVGMTFMEHLMDFLKFQKSSGGNVVISGLDAHVSSSTHRRALKISLTGVEPKLSPRQIRLKNLADEYNWQFTSQVDWNTSYLRNFHFFEIRPIERKDNCLNGSFEDINMDWEIADVTFSEGAAFTAEVFNTTVMILKLNQKIPVFSMEKEGMFEKLFDRIMAFTGYKDIDFKMYPEFSNKFLLMGNNAEDIRSFFNEQLIRFFESQHVFHIESNGEALLIFDKVKLARTDETLKIIEFGERLAQLIGK
ncbi:MAG: hypothetical protein KJP00_09610, partial [Bacteroidia bacterium]|nr:hypothetical protein [Bacteroidia bacterium]